MKNWEKYAYRLAKMVVNAPEDETEELFSNNCPFQEHECDRTCPAWLNGTQMCVSGSLGWWHTEAERTTELERKYNDLLQHVKTFVEEFKKLDEDILLDDEREDGYLVALDRMDDLIYDHFHDEWCELLAPQTNRKEEA